MKPGRFILFAAITAALFAGYAHSTHADDSKHHHHYSNASLHRAYAGEFSGTVISNGSALPIGGTGIFAADGKGNISGQESYEFNGTPCNATVSGTYTVNPDGSGTDNLTFTATGQGCQGGSYTQSFAIGDSGRLVVLANSSPGQIINEIWHAQN